MFRRGLQLEALREFILSQGASKNVTLQEWDKIWTINKKMVDPVCPRHTAIKAEGRVLLKLSNGPDVPEVVTVPRHKKHPPAGVKATTKTKVPSPSIAYWWFNALPPILERFRIDALVKGLCSTPPFLAWPGTGCVQFHCYETRRWDCWHEQLAGHGSEHA